MRLIKTVDAIGKTLCHDITQIVKDDFKGVKFKKGHVIKDEDVDVLHSLGKFNIYVWEADDVKYVHENDASEILANMCVSENLRKGEVKEGKTDLFAEIDGLYKINSSIIKELNSIDEIIISTRHNNFPIKKDEKVLGTRIIPLVVTSEVMDKANSVYKGEPLCTLKPFTVRTCGVITTGREVFEGIIEDTFTPVIKAKLLEYGVEIIYHKTVTDDIAEIQKAIKEAKTKGVDMILCTGGMSVDPDDVTPTAIKESGANLVVYGTPVLPGAMLLLAYFDDDTPVLGLPGCVMYSKRTVFDLVLPRVLARDIITKSDIDNLGIGGLCFDCPQCHFPNCSFGKGE
ncbi:MAG: molybdopterin-binding protein [Lachnospirales bacterium]